MTPRILLVAVMLLTLDACSGGDRASFAVPGGTAPAWALPSVNRAARVESKSFAGRPMYLNFFATWCTPCGEEAPWIESIHRSYPDIAVVGVDELENVTHARSFARQYRLSYPVVVDGGELRDAYNVNGLPVHVFIRRNGIIDSIHAGEMTQQQIAAAVRHSSSGADD